MDMFANNKCPLCDERFKSRREVEFHFGKCQKDSWIDPTEDEIFNEIHNPKHY